MTDPVNQEQPDPRPMQSPLSHSDIVDREEPEAGAEPLGKPASTRQSAHDAAGADSVAGEEDPGAGMDAPV